MNLDQIYKAWQAVGADIAGLNWNDFVKAIDTRPSLPDEITDKSESPEYRSGWNECREVMAGIQAEHEADKVIIEYHKATIKRLEAELKARGNT